ncbi:conserved exported protein of unknown function [Nitrospira japonica]|uniref:OmpA-like domain-containing protein n=1 Tax=Nitrospira japonica TaxID=1325564 RepID=A0A1W1I3R8_9BACT|nr:OmpA family protein [Nitrospira japonica]SLM47483.1 conserved exported protein of unknown function [Nitrospira japonica]
MSIYFTRTASACLLSAMTLAPVVAWADDLDTIRFGEAALSFASGSIQRTTPQDGVVNVTTGDNQTTGDRMQLGLQDTLYLRLKNPADASVGDLYTVFKRARKVFHPVTREYLGYLVIRLAVVEVVQVDKTLITVRAIRAYGAVSPGDPVAKFALPTESEPDSTPSSGAVNGIVVELQADKGMTLVAQRNIVYVDRGSHDGLRAGDVVEVIRSGGNLPPRNVGEIKILSTEARTSTALITRSTSRILPGDRFRIKASEGDAVPVSMPVPHEVQPLNTTRQDANALQAVEAVPSQLKNTQPVSRETRITLSDPMKQLRYESGEAAIRPDGYKILDALTEYLKTAPADQLIRVEGHADDMEIGPALKSRYQTNWDLSKARASGVLRYLVEKGGIDSARISSVGYGDTKPLVSNATEAGRQKNRRVDVVLYLPESDPTLPEQTRGAVIEERAQRVGGPPVHKSEVSMASADQVPAPPTVTDRVPERDSAVQVQTEKAAESAAAIAQEQPPAEASVPLQP